VIYSIFTLGFDIILWKCNNNVINRLYNNTQISQKNKNKEYSNIVFYLLFNINFQIFINKHIFLFSNFYTIFYKKIDCQIYFISKNNIFFKSALIQTTSVHLLFLMEYKIQNVLSSCLLLFFHFHVIIN
jgi:hypothetical protein